MFWKYFKILLVAFGHGPEGVAYLRIGDDILGFLLFFIGFPILPFKIRNIFFKGIIPHILELEFKFVAC
jgi:hypothetical protein